ncbi:MAG: protein kinase [Elusimicrobia bacterium]|nr:protein kinase [Elusimicrobiota bacterium]
MKRVRTLLWLVLPLCALCPLSAGDTTQQASPPQGGSQDPELGPYYQRLDEANEYIHKYEYRRDNQPLLHAAGCFWAIFSGGCEKRYKQARSVRDDLEDKLSSGQPLENILPELQRLEPELEKAVKKLRKAAWPATGGGGAPTGLGKKHREDYDKAIDRALGENPESAEGWSMSAQNKLGKGDFAGAASDASRAIALGGGPEAYAMRSAANTQLGEYESAVSDAQEALKADPKNEMAFQSLMLSQGRGQAQGSGGGGGAPAAAAPTTGWRAPTAAVKQTSPKVLQSAELAKRAQSALTLRDYKAALGLLNQAIELNPRNGMAFFLRATAYNQLRRYGEALADAEAGLGLSPDNVPLLNAKALAQNRLKDYRGAYATAQSALAFNPNSADAYANLAHALGGMGDRQGMMDNLAKAAALDPRYQAVLANIEVQAPTESDIMFLFPGEEGFEAAPKAGPAKDAPRSFGVVAVAAIAGGFLIALGLLRALGPSPWRTLRSKLSRLSGSSPAVSDLDLEEAEAPSTPAAEAPPPEPRPLGGQYDIIRQIGEGGMGLVFEARDRGLQRRVAIKKMRPEIRDNAGERQRFLAEAKTVAALKHPAIVEIFSIFEEEGEVYLVFEFVQGKTLFELGQKGPMAFGAAKAYFRDVASALDYAHTRKVIHRDMKPSNVMIDEEGKARVMDFGVARVAKDALTRVAMTQTVMGTPPYMSPEAEQGVVSPQGDVYSMAVCLYEALSGRLPFTGIGSGLLMNKMSASYKPISEILPGLPPGVDAVFSRAFVPDMAKRYAAAGEMLADLERLSPVGLPGR